MWICVLNITTKIIDLPNTPKYHCKMLQILRRCIILQAKDYPRNQELNAPIHLMLQWFFFATTLGMEEFVLWFDKLSYISFAALYSSKLTARKYCIQPWNIINTHMVWYLYGMQIDVQSLAKLVVPLAVLNILWCHLLSIRVQTQGKLWVIVNMCSTCNNLLNSCSSHAWKDYLIIKLSTCKWIPCNHFPSNLTWVTFTPIKWNNSATLIQILHNCLL